MRKLVFRLLRVTAACAALIAGYAVLLCLPDPFFAHSVRAGNLSLHSDQPMTEDAARKVLDLSRTKLLRSPLYAGEPKVAAYLCNARWRERLFFNKDYGVAGVAYPFSMKVFLREAAVDENRLISRRGIHVPGIRTLDFFVAHEMTHALTSRAVGPIGMLKLPQWVREGYADYVAWGPAFHYKDARQAFLAGVPEMDYARSGLYWRFTLLVAHLLDKKHWTVDRLLAGPFPDQKRLEDEIRQGE